MALCSSHYEAWPTSYALSSISPLNSIVDLWVSSILGQCHIILDLSGWYPRFLWLKLKTLIKTLIIYIYTKQKVTAVLFSVQLFSRFLVPVRWHRAICRFQVWRGGGLNLEELPWGWEAKKHGRHGSKTWATWRIVQNSWWRELVKTYYIFI